MKRSKSIRAKDVRAPLSGRARKTSPQKNPKGQTIRLSPARKGATAKLPGLLSEHCPGPETVAVQLKFYQPQAHEVFVAGAFNDWQSRATPLMPCPNGEWAVDLMLKPGSYEYRYVVDGQWVDDPMASRFAANPFGGLNSVIEVHARE